MNSGKPQSEISDLLINTSAPSSFCSAISQIQIENHSLSPIRVKTIRSDMEFWGMASSIFPKVCSLQIRPDCTNQIRRPDGAALFTMASVRWLPCGKCASQQLELPPEETPLKFNPTSRSEGPLASNRERSPAGVFEGAWLEQLNAEPG
jgi:hypothetical protein